MTLKILRYSESELDRWDNFADMAFNATFLHTRRFLSYHKDRFYDMSLLIMNEKQILVGLFPAAIDPFDSKTITSHPGITYGGMIYGKHLRGENMIHAMTAISHFYRKQGFENIRYKAVPHIYHKVPAADDLYALFRLGASLYRCDLSCAIDLSNRKKFISQRRIRSLKNAFKYGIRISEDIDHSEPLWEVLEENLMTKYGIQPVHSLKEIQYLHSLFPQNIRFVSGLYGAEVVAGVVLFCTAQTVHTQYIASSLAGYRLSALDMVIDHCIEKAGTTGARFFNFGVSTENEGHFLNSGLHQFKAEFGGGGVIHEFYDWQILF